MSMFVYHRQTRGWHRRWYRGCIFMSSGHDGHRISCLSPLWSADNITRQVRNTQITHTKKPHIHNILQERKYGQLVWINTTLKSTTNYWASRYLQVTHVSPLFWAHVFFSRMTWNHFRTYVQVDPKNVPYQFCCKDWLSSLISMLQAVFMIFAAIFL